MKKFFLITIMLLLIGGANAQSYVRQGQGDYNTVLYTWDGKYIRQGQGDYNTVLYTWDGKYLRKGQGDYNTVLYTISGKVPTAILIFIAE